MSFDTNIQNVVTRMATESKSLRTLINGNSADLSGLTTTQKTSIVAAINELDAAIDGLAGGGSAAQLDDLTDVVIGATALGQILRHNGANWVNVDPSAYFDAAGAAAAAQAASQPLDADLTAISSLTTDPYGRNFLTLANQAALMALLASASDTAAGIVELATPAEATAGLAGDRAVTPAGLQAAIDALVAAAPGTMDTLNELAAALGDDPNFATTVTAQIAAKQDGSADLTAIAALTSAANQLPYATGAGTWAMTTLTAFGRSLVAAADAAGARTVLDVYSKTEIGSVTTDYVALFEAGLV